MISYGKICLCCLELLNWIYLQNYLLENLLWPKKIFLKMLWGKFKQKELFFQNSLYPDPVASMQADPCMVTHHPSTWRLTKHDQFCSILANRLCICLPPSLYHFPRSTCFPKLTCSIYFGVEIELFKTNMSGMNKTEVKRMHFDQPLSHWHETTPWILSVRVKCNPVDSLTFTLRKLSLWTQTSQTSSSTQLGLSELWGGCVMGLSSIWIV